MKTLRLILGDQLNIKHSWFKQVNPDVFYCIFEMQQETNYVTHHIQKIIGFFAAMRQFASDITSKGHQVIYYKINELNNTQDLVKNLSNIINANQISCFEYIYPDEYRLDEQLLNYSKTLSIQVNRVSAEHFYTTRNELETFFKGKKQYLMESFYRYMRVKHQILLIVDQPEGGKWNYDKSNRNKWDEKAEIPSAKYFNNEVSQVVNDIKQANIKTIGMFNGNTFTYPITRVQALEQLKYFCEALLIHFGDYQDAMHTQETYLFHSRLSFALNLKLISPKDVVTSVLNFYRAKKDFIDISQVEGFIRQIIGWREYMRGMYWMLMPNYKNINELKNYNKLPDFYWTGKTKMNCLKHAITNSLNNGYAHHIQRLMITGNYALLTQTHPDEVDDWYLGIYVDAIEWVQLTNTRGMSQYADGGIIATKPYISSGSYIHKMSNYCEACFYKKDEKTGLKACPFNALYWNFLDQNRQKLQTNYRMKLMYSVLDKISINDLEKIKDRANHIIQNPNDY